MSRFYVVREIGISSFGEVVLALLFVLHSKKEELVSTDEWIPKRAFLALALAAQEKGLIPRYLDSQNPEALPEVLNDLCQQGFLASGEGGIRFTETGLKTLPISVLLPVQRQMFPFRCTPGYYAFVPDIGKLGMLADELAADLSQPPP